MNEDQGEDEENTLHDSDDQKVMVQTVNWIDDETVPKVLDGIDCSMTFSFTIVKLGH